MEFLGKWLHKDCDQYNEDLQYIWSHRIETMSDQDLYSEIIELSDESHYRLLSMIDTAKDARLHKKEYWAAREKEKLSKMATENKWQTEKPLL